MAAIIRSSSLSAACAPLRPQRQNKPHPGYNRSRPAHVAHALRTRVPTPDSPSYPSEHAAAAGAAAAVLAYLFPAKADSFDAMAQQAGDAMVAGGIQYPSDIAAERAIQHGRADGSDLPWTGSIPSTPGTWTGTNPVLPQMAAWKTWVLTAPSQFRPAPPPAYNSPDMAAQVATVKNFTRTVASNTAVYFWASAFVYKLWATCWTRKYSSTASTPTLRVPHEPTRFLPWLNTTR